MLIPLSAECSYGGVPDTFIKWKLKVWKDNCLESHVTHEGSARNSPSGRQLSREAPASPALFKRERATRVQTARGRLRHRAEAAAEEATGWGVVPSAQSRVFLSDEN